MKPLFILLAIAFATTATAQHMQHGQHGQNGETEHLSEIGQSAFAAISEVTARLQADLDTDWSQVSIDRLRAHLVDMDLVFSGAHSVTERTSDGAIFTLTGAAEVRDAIRRMLFAHSSVGDFPETWTATASEIVGGASLRLIAPAQDHEKIAALGIFGLLADGDHHRRHHWMMATGQSVH